MTFPLREPDGYYHKELETDFNQPEQGRWIRAPRVIRRSDLHAGFFWEWCEIQAASAAIHIEAKIKPTNTASIGFIARARSENHAFDFSRAVAPDSYSITSWTAGLSSGGTNDRDWSTQVTFARDEGIGLNPHIASRYLRVNEWANLDIWLIKLGTNTLMSWRLDYVGNDNSSWMTVLGIVHILRPISDFDRVGLTANHVTLDSQTWDAIQVKYY